MHIDIFCHTLSRESSLGGIAAFLRRPRLSWPRLGAVELRPISVLGFQYRFWNKMWLQLQWLQFAGPTGVCEISTHLDGAGVFNVPTPLSLFQSWRKDAQQELTNMSVYLTDRLHSPRACPWTLTLGGMGGVRHWPQVGWVFISQTPVWSMLILPTNITPANMAWVIISGKIPMGLGIYPLMIKIMLESNPLKSAMLVGRLGVDWIPCPLVEWNPLNVVSFLIKELSLGCGGAFFVTDACASGRKTRLRAFTAAIISLSLSLYISLYTYIYSTHLHIL